MKTKPVTDIQWLIFYRDREYAREKGDPVLGCVEAPTKEEAEKSGAPLGGMAGILAVLNACTCGDLCVMRNATYEGAYYFIADSEGAALAESAGPIMPDDLAAFELGYQAGHQRGARYGRIALQVDLCRLIGAQFQPPIPE